MRILGVASGIAVAATLARGLSHADFGRLALVLSLVAMATAVSDLGLTNTAIRQLSVEPESDREILGSLISARAVTGFVGALLVGAVALAIDGSPQMKVVGPLVAATLLLSPVSSWLAIAQARLKLGRVNGLLLLQSLLWTTFVLVLAALHAPLVGYAWGFLGSASIQAAATWLSLRSYTRPTFVGSVARLRQLATVAWPIAVGGFFVTAYYRIDGVILYQLKGPIANADYSAAYRVLDVLQFLPGALLLVVLPLLSATWRTGVQLGAEKRARLFRLASTVTMAMSLPVAVGGALLAPRLVRLVYGETYVDAGPLLAILMLGFPAISFGYVAVGLALASGKTKLYAITAATAAVFNIVANILLIPGYGAVAAAWTTVATEFAVAGTLLLVLTRRERLPLPWSAWLGSIVATVCMAGVLLVLGGAPLGVLIIVPGCVYAVAALGFKAVRWADVKSVMSRRKLEW
ncbi:oligosaccharide flippase family protein [Demequina sp. SO4-13]|uniref:oligosaccharide flippase family protein n=1 Tax=Demequina sp. SO4-13 TaxID=3401027 RepID=UPI003AF685D8